jgi:hypothetical protein
MTTMKISIVPVSSGDIARLSKLVHGIEVRRPACSRREAIATEFAINCSEGEFSWRATIYA